MKRVRWLAGLMLVLLIIGSAGIMRAQDSGGSDLQILAMTLKDYRDYLRDHLPLDRLFIMGESAFFLVNRPVVDQCRAAGIDCRVSPVDFPPETGVKTGGNGDYHSYAETGSLLHDLAARFPEIARVFSIGRSVEGRELWVIKISDHVGTDEAEANVFITGCHHGREWISVEVPLLFARYLLEQYGENKQVREAVDQAQVYILPIQNPDGLEFSIQTYRMWRKNRRYNQDLAWGVDNNRNYGFMWGFDNQGSSPLPADAVYRGPFPFSEPENQAVKDFLLANPPHGALNFHNFAQMILYPWGYTESPCPDNAEMEDIARNMSVEIRRVNGRVYSYGAGATTIYPTNGDADDWIYATFGVPAFTIELPPELFIEGGFFTPEEIIQSVFREMQPAMIYFIETIISRNLNQ